MSSVLVAVIVSGYYFPVFFTFLPSSLNSKMIIAVLGLLIFVLDALRNRTAQINKYIIGAFALSVLFSVICYNAADKFNTSDDSYTTYYMTFFVWIFGAYGVCQCIKAVHGRITVRLITAYIAAVCVAQCASALLIDNVPAISSWVDSYFFLGQDFMHEINRLYGIGAALDPAGVRFSVELILIAHVLATNNYVRTHGWLSVYYIISFLAISVIGNMISRTTTAGMLGGAFYFLVSSMLNTVNKESGKSKVYRNILGVLAATSGVVVVLYNTNTYFNGYMHFAFEGFFNWAETGIWRTDSTDKLNNVMWIWPETTEGWIWGTGRFGNFFYSTDIGYCRFVLYCGLVGFSVFILYFFYNSYAIAKSNPDCALLAMAFLILTFIIWFKVATDIFFVFALLYQIDSFEERNEDGKDCMDDESETPEANLLYG